MSGVTEHRFALRPRDGIALAARKWSDCGEPRAVMVVAHGMGEHSARYLAPLEPIIASGIVTYALDHRGHGASVPEGGVFGDYGLGGFAGVVSDLLALVEQVRAENPRLPVILLGHSMGSFIAQAFAIEHSGTIDLLALSGSGAVDIIARAVMDPTKTFDLNASFAPARTDFDWLSRDEAEVDTYIDDPWCGFSLVPESFGDLLSQGPRMADPAQLARIRPDLPIYIFSGDRDPLYGDYHAVQPLIDRYQATGLAVDVHIYSEARHEVLNEINRDEVVTDLRNWLERHLR